MILEKLIEAAKDGNQSAMLKIIEKFRPILRKYTRLENYSEDVHSELVLNLIELIHTINLKQLNCTNDYALINYISTALYHSYIRIVKQKSTITQHEQQTDDVSIFEQASLSPGLPSFTNDIVLKDFLVTSLTPREYFCVNSIILQGDTASNVASKLGVSRQAVNQAKKRAMDKLNKLLREYSHR